MSEMVLEVRGLTKRFGALAASKDVSLDLRRGEIHAVIGPNGAGKSTLIGLITGNLIPDAGSVHLSGRDITSDTVQARAQAGLARTFQISSLAMEDTVLENAVLGVLGASQRPWRFWRNALGDKGLTARALAALEQVGLGAHANTVCQELSHGQRRQLEVAVALTLQPRAFLMDEPMAGLGAEGSQTMTAFLDGLRAEAPILLVEHDMDAVFALADRISVLDYGQIIATGTVAEIKGNPKVRQAYLGEDA
ncbi:MAG: ABC transporter ATP-binding protein [Pseudomonadota bacterium]